MVKGQTAASGGEPGTVTLGAAVGQGVFHSRKRYVPTAESESEDSRRDVAFGYRAFSRRVGARYSIQVIFNSLPLLLVDILVLTATIAACRLLFYQLGARVGIDVSACLIPIASGFVFLNFGLGLYPGTRLSPVEELRRLVVSVTCMFVVWTVGVIMVVGTLGIQRWFLLLVYPACLLTLPIARGWARHLLGKFTNWGIPVLVFGDDLAAVRLYHWLADNHHLGLRPSASSAIATAWPRDRMTRRGTRARGAKRQTSPKNGTSFGPSSFRPKANQPPFPRSLPITSTRSRKCTFYRSSPACPIIGTRSD